MTFPFFGVRSSNDGQLLASTGNRQPGKGEAAMAKSKPYLGTLVQRSGVYYLDMALSVGGQPWRKKICLHTGNKVEAVKKATEETDGLKAKKNSAKVEKWLEEKQSTTKELLDRILLAEAWEHNPYTHTARGERHPLSQQSQRENKVYWADFVEWMGKNHPQTIYMGQVVESMAKEYARFLESQGQGSRSHNVRMMVCKVMFDLAGIKENPFDARNLKRKEVKISRQDLSENELRGLFEVLKGKGTAEDRLLIMLGMCTGMRLGDCCLLRWDEVQGTHIRKVTAKRGIPVSLQMHPMLEAAMAATPRQGEYVLEGYASIYKRDASTVCKSVDALFRLAGIETSREIEGRKKAVSVKGFHALRTSFITQAARCGVPISLISSWVGHSPEVDRIYQQWGQAERDARLVGALDTKLTSIFGEDSLALPSPSQSKSPEGRIDSIISQVFGKEKTPKEQLLELIEGLEEKTIEVVLSKLKKGKF